MSCAFIDYYKYSFKKIYYIYYWLQGIKKECEFQAGKKIPQIFSAKFIASAASTRLLINSMQNYL